jgi:hypothetical protein
VQVVCSQCNPAIAFSVTGDVAPSLCKTNYSLISNAEQQNFESTDWRSTESTGNIVTTCGFYSLIGGISIGVTGSSLYKVFKELPAHSTMFLYFTLFFIDQAVGDLSGYQIQVDDVLQEIRLRVSCLDSDYSPCDHCDDTWRNNDFREWAGDEACPSCHDNSAHTCDDCGAERWDGDDHYEYCEGSSDDDDDSYSSAIRAWDYEVLDTLNFLGQPADKLWLGVELEVECKSDSGWHRGELADEVAAAMAGFAVLKSDGSLNNGFEIVTAPATIEIHRTEWTKRFYGKSFIKGLRSWDAGTCGLHVHISRQPLSKLTQAKIVGFCNIEENRTWMEKLAGRTSHYAEFKNVEQLGEQWGYQRSRYRVVNVENADTLEFRIFKGSLRPERLWRALEFVHSLVKFCEQTSLEKLQASQYLEWLGKHKKLYPSLAEFYFPKAVAAKRNPKQPGLFTVVADSCQGDVEDNSAVVYDADKELAAQRAIEERVAKQRRARKEREREEKQREKERMDARVVAREPAWYGSREPEDVVARAADAEFQAYATPERIGQTRRIYQRRVDESGWNSWEAIRTHASRCVCLDCRLIAHVAELVIQEQRDAAMVAQTAYDYSVMEAVRHLSTAAEAAAEPEHRESGAGERAT